MATQAHAGESPWWWSPVGPGTAGSPAQRRGYRWGLLAVAVAGLGFGLLGIAGKAPSPDESETVVAVWRSWPDLFALMAGADAPLMPYYVLAKLWAALLGWLPTLVAIRVLSAVAMTVAAVCLYQFALRHAGVLAGAMAAVLFTGFPGVSRFAQEARPTALLLAAAGFSWVMWQSWRRPDRLPRGREWLPAAGRAAGYFLGLAVSALMSLFGFLQWPAQVLADLTGTAAGRRPRIRRALQSVVVMVLALLVTGLATVPAALRGTGPDTQTDIVSLTTLGRNLLRVLANGVSGPAMAIGAITVVLAAVAVIAVLAGRGLRSRYGEVVRLATIWFAVPLLGSIAIAMVRPNLLRPRYWLPTAPPLALLAVIGALVLAELAYRAVKRSATGRDLSAATAAVLVALLPLGLLTVLTVPIHRELRQDGGHGTSVQQLFARLDELLAEDPDLPILVSPPPRAMVVMALRPELTPRNALIAVDESASKIWPPRAKEPAVAAALTGENTVIWVRSTYATTHPPAKPPAVLAGFEIVDIESVESWWIIRLER